MKKIISTITIFALLISVLSFAVNAKDTTYVKIRIEGANTTYYYDTFKTDITAETKVSDVLVALDKSNEGLTITGADKGYITEVNGEKAAQFGGWDGWYYTVNDTAPDVGVSSFTVKDGDSIVLYYGDYPCQYPKVDTSNFDKGILSFVSYDATYDLNYNATYSWTPITSATVTVNGTAYTTDDKGSITVDTATLKDENAVQISKKSTAGCPQVCPLASDFTVKYPPEATTDEPTTVAPTEATTEAVTTEPATTSPVVTTPTTEPTQPTTVKPSLAKKSVSLKAGKTAKITVKNAGSNKITYKSSNSKVAKVTAKGNVTAFKKGSAKITVTAGSTKLTYSVAVTSNPKLSKKTISVKKGKTVTVKITGKASGVNNVYTNTKLAKITSKKSATTLKVKGLKKGKTTLKIKINGVTLKLNVKIK